MKKLFSGESNRNTTGKAGQMKQTSLMRWFIIISVSLFLVILIGGSIAFVFSMRQIIRVNKGTELSQMIEMERLKLETSVNNEIAIALKMAGSPLIQEYFVNPGDPELGKLAFREITAYRYAFASKSLFWVNDTDRMFYSDDNEPFWVDADNPDNYWYIMTLRETDVYNFNINYNPDLRVTNLWINAPVFDGSKKPIGILGTGIDLSAFIDTIYKNFSGGAALYFFNDAGEITGAKDVGLVAAKKNIEQELGETGAGIIANAKSLKAGETKVFSTSTGNMAIGTIPLLGWYSVAVMDDSIADYNTTITWLFLVVLVVIFIIFIIFNFILAKLFVKPLKTVVGVIQEISRDWNLTRRIEDKKTAGIAEIFAISRVFNVTFDNLKNLVSVIKNKINALTNTGHELTINMQKTSAAVDHIAANFEGIKGMEVKQKKGSVEVNKAIDNIKTSIDLQIKMIEEQAGSVNTSSSAIEEMTANIHSVTQTLVENSKNVKDLTEASEHGRTALQTVAEEIQVIARDSEGLLEINSLMENIASQTNLLSMNAAIEAAHAGESGKGFAVVADEIRKLAESSSEQSKTTAAMLKKIKTSIDNITKSSDEVLERFGAIDSGVKTVSEHELNIRNAMEEQETGGKQILDAIGRLKEITVSVQKGSEDMSKSGSDLIRETDEFIKVSNEAMSGMSEIVNGALMEIKTAVTHVTEMSVENNTNFESLKVETEKFKTSTGQEKKKVLAIDDDEIQLEMIDTFLKESYDVITVKSCEETLKLLYHGLDPAFILLDIMMPETDGWVTYTRIKGISDLHRVPIAFLTASNDPAHVKRAKEMGAVDYIKKPTSRDELLGIIKRALG